MANSSAQLVEQAQKRASITGWLSQNPGMHSVQEIAEALDISRGSAGLLLYHMANEGLLAHKVNGTTKLYAMGSMVPDELMHSDVVELEDSPRRRRRRSGREVELVVAGTQIVIGRNPDTGRLRISLEDVE